MKKLFVAFKELPKGIFRLIIVCGFLIPLIIGIVLQSIAPYPAYGQEDFTAAIIYGPIIYWILTIIAMWVYEGFKEDKSKGNG